MEKIDLRLLVLAALLHDIGKPAQRAGRGKTDQMEGEYCPSGNHGPTHKHVLYSDYFIENELPLPSDFDRSRLARLASAHHKPGESDLLEKAIQRGDCLSAGTDRVSLDEASKESFRDVPLKCIFSGISLHEKPKDATLSYPLSRIDDGSFPSAEAKAGKQAYASLFENFLKELEAIPLDMGPRHYVAALDAVLERYMWSVPSSTWKDEPDISLYDHSITTAAIAQALAVYHTEKGGLPGSDTTKAKKFLLVGGDLSGIQKFIFDLDKSHGSGVAKLLRARSFYLQALTRSVIAALLDKLQLMPQAKIMDAGGRFVLLLPATERVESALEEFVLSLQDWLLKRHSGRLALHLNWDVKLTESDFKLDQFRQKLDELNDGIEASKLKAFDRALAHLQSPVMELDYSQYETGPCQVCGIAPAEEKPSTRYQEDHEVSLGICWNCWGLIEKIGKKLPRPESRLMVLGRDIGNPDMEFFDGIRLVFAEKVEHAHRNALEVVGIKARGPYAFQPIAGHMPTWSQADLDRWDYEGRSLTDEDSGIPSPGDPKTFSALAKESQEVVPDQGLQGKVLLGALKADVDNLGLVFSLGLGERISISRTVTLSRMLNHFFAEHLVSVIKRDYPDIYVIFAGGDDLYVLGPWAKTVRFAAFMQQEFERFCGNNPDVTISAGITVVKPSLPVQSISEHAERLLEKSKTLGKNAVTLFGVTAPWPEYQRLLDQGTRFRDLALRGEITKGVLGRLLTYGRNIREFNNGDMRKGISLSHMQYDFKRNLGNDELRAEFNGMVQDRQALARLDLPVSYALYRMRTD